MNLLDNAMRHNDSDVCVRVTVFPGGDDMVAIRVADNGDGYVGPSSVPTCSTLWTRGGYGRAGYRVRPVDRRAG